MAVVIAGLGAVGATPAQTSSALVAHGVLMALTSVALSARLRLPVAVVWSTPGAALLLGTGALQGGFPAAVGALLVAGALVVLTGLVPPLGRLVSALPPALTAAVLAGVLLPFCLRAVVGVAELPVQCGAIAVVWLAAQRLAPAWSAPAALLALVAVVLASGGLPAGGAVLPSVEVVAPRVTWEGVVRIAVPLYLVTMAAQNLVGVAVLVDQGYRPPVGALLVGTGLASVVAAPLGGPTLNLAAITGALTAGPSAHPDPARRWVAAAASGLSYLVLAPLAPLASALIAGTDQRLVATAAGLALTGALAGALAGAVPGGGSPSAAQARTRPAAVVALVVTASGVGGAPALGLAAGLLLLLATRRRRGAPAEGP